MKILIAVPTYENIFPDTFKSIYELDKGGHDVAFDFFRGYNVETARNKIGRATLDGGYDYVLMVDNDVVLPSDALVNLIESQQSAKIPGMSVGYCLFRAKGADSPGDRTAIFKFTDKSCYVREDTYTGAELKALRDRGAFRVQIRGAGFSCALIQRDVFGKMNFPWFRWVTYANGEQFSEDLYFCSRLQGLSIPIFVDTRVACGHMMRTIKWPQGVKE